MNHLQSTGNLLETDRLTLRLLSEGDASFILELLNSPGWLEFIGDRNVRTTADAVSYLQDGPLRSYATHGFGLSLVELKGYGTPIGLCGLLKRDYLEHPDIGFAFLPDPTGIWESGICPRNSQCHNGLCNRKAQHSSGAGDGPAH